MTNKNEKLHVRHGLDFVRGQNRQPILMTRKQAQAYIEEYAEKYNAYNHKNAPLFKGVVALIESPISNKRFFNVSLAGQKEV